MAKRKSWLRECLEVHIRWPLGEARFSHFLIYKTTGFTDLLLRILMNLY
jgi:hypothetical protein